MDTIIGLRACPIQIQEMSRAWAPLQRFSSEQTQNDRNPRHRQGP